jgi:uncharacterized protein (TIGR03435 family)
VASLPMVAKKALLAIAAAALAAPHIHAQSVAAIAKFEVASIKLCRDGDLSPDGKSGGHDGNFSPGTLRLDCATVKDLINGAYVLFANGHVNPRSRLVVEGGPAWIERERYRIDAKAEGPQSQGTMRGPMLQALLENRFKLKIKRVMREVPAFALTVAKGGPKLRRFREGSCVPLDLKILEQFPPPPFPDLPPGKQYCGGIDPADGSRWVAAVASMRGPNVTLEARAMSIDEFIQHALGPKLDRPLLNKTGIAGRFDFHLEYAADETGPVPSDAAGPSISTALQKQLGLRLEPAKGTREVLVIDHVERPSGN